MLTLESLGSARLQLDTHNLPASPRVKQYLLLTYLAERAKPQTREEIANLFWPDSPRKQQFGSLRYLVNRLKNEGFEDHLVVSRDTLNFTNFDKVSFDLREVRSIAADLNNSSLDQLQMLFDLYKGPFLGGINLDSYPQLSDWAYAIQHEVETILCQAYMLIAPRLLAADAEQEVIKYGQTVTELAPYDDQMWALHIRCLIACGQIAEALKVLNQYRKQVLEIYPDHQFSAELMEIGAQLSKPEQLARYLAPQKIQIPLSRPYSKVNAENHIVSPQGIIGREAESAKLASFLDKGFRLVSIVGLGGVGKTYFVRSQIPALLHRFGSEILFIELQQLEFADQTIVSPTSSAQLLPFIAEQLEVLPSSTGSTLDQIVDRLNNRSACLILDNFESAIDEADSVSVLLNRLPHLTVIATSRNQLKLKQECILQINGLEAVGGQTPETLFGPATKLFERSAQQQQPEFQLTPENGTTVIELCKELGGLPLAIELLAKQLNLFTLEELISSSSNRAQLLQSNAIDLPPQHQSVFKILENMWQKLSIEAQKVLPELTRFSNQWGREAMEAIAPAELSVYQELLQTSMLQQVGPGTFTLHPLVKRFASGQKATDLGDSFILGYDGKHHIDYHAKQAKQSSQGLALTDKQDLKLRFDLLQTLIRSRVILMEDLHGLIALGENLLKMAEQIGSKKRIIWAVYVQGIIYQHIGKYQESLNKANTAYELAIEANRVSEISHTLFRKALCLQYLSETQKALKTLTDCKLMLQKQPNADLQTRAEYLECLIHIHLGQTELAKKLILAFIEKCKKQNLPVWHCNGLNLLFQTNFDLAEFDEAVATLEEAIELANKIGNRIVLPILTGNLAIIQSACGQFDEAIRNTIFVSDYFLQNGQIQYFITTQIVLSKLYTWTNQYDQAEEILNTISNLLTEVEFPLVKARTWLTFGNFLVATRQYRRAVEVYTIAEEVVPENNHLEIEISIQCGMAWAYCELGDHEKAGELANKVWPEMKDNEFLGEWEWGTAAVCLIQVLEFAKDERAGQLLTHINRVIQVQAARFKELKYREGYLNNRPDIRWLVEQHTKRNALHCQEHR